MVVAPRSAMFTAAALVALGAGGFAAVAFSAPARTVALIQAGAQAGGQPDGDDDGVPDEGADRLDQKCDAPLKNGAAPQTNWHYFSSCLRVFRDNWHRARGGDVAQVADMARQRVIAAMSLDDVGFRDARRSLRGQAGFATFFGADGSRAAPADLEVAWLNDLGQPYNGMGHGGLAYYLFQLAESAQRGGYPLAAQDTQMYRALGAAVLRPIVLDTRKGGLDTVVPCVGLRGKSCGWYHSVTRRDRPADAGLTLNQNLHVLRDLGRIVDLHRRAGWPVPAGFDNGIAMGLNQLFQPGQRSAKGQLPTFADYLSDPVGRQKVRWLYYGFNADKPVGTGGYFLNKNGKDCSYQIHVLDLTSQILERAQRLGTWQAPAGALTCSSPLAETYRSTRIRMSMPDPDMWSSPFLQRDTVCPAKAQETFAKVRADFYAAAFDHCG